jgi:hypothetical protein
MTPYQFGMKVAFELPGQPPLKAPATPAPIKAQVLKTPAPTPAKPNTNPSSSLRTTMGNMVNNAGRFSGGMLATTAGTAGAIGTGAAAGYTNAWNRFAPKSMQTSQAWSQGINDAAKRTTDFAHAGAKDMYGSLGGDMNYNNSHSWNQMQQGLDSMPQNTTTDRVLSNAANIGAYGGAGAWNVAQGVANPGKIMANLPRAGVSPTTWASAGSRIMPRAVGGVTNTATASRAVPQMARAGTAVNMADTASNLTVQLPNAGMQLMPSGEKQLLDVPYQEPAAPDIYDTYASNN